MNKVIINQYVNQEQNAQAESVDILNLNIPDHVEIVPNSVESIDISSEYSGLENESLSNSSIELPFQAPIIVMRKNLLSNNGDTTNKAVILNEQSDMSIDSPTFEPEILENASFIGSGTSSYISKIVGKNNTREQQQLFCTNTALETSDMSLEASTSNVVIIEHRNHRQTVCDRNTKKSDKTNHVSPDDELSIESCIEESTGISPRLAISLELMSPELFNGDGPEKIAYLESHSSDYSQVISPPIKNKEKYIGKLDRELLRSVQYGLSGVLPPHSLTITNISVSDMLFKLKMNKEYFWWNAEIKDNNYEDTNGNISLDSSNVEVIDKKRNSLLINVRSEEEVSAIQYSSDKWPDILHHRYYGLHHNRGTMSEEIENLCDKYQKRFIGAETQSSCILHESPKVSPRKNRTHILKWGSKSPGKRLSHLAKRKITFSGTNSHIAGPLVGSRARQILVDARKLASLRKSPKKSPRKTPGKSSRSKPRTPTSSAKKNLAMKFRKMSGENARRVLFTSPRKLSPTKSKKSPFKHALIFGPERKRKRSDWDEPLHAAKFPRSMSVDVPSKSCYGNKSFTRTQSELLVPSNKLQSTQELSDAQKRKLQWAVYDALQSTNTTRTHPQWKLFAAVLGKVVKYFYLGQMATNIAKGIMSECGTTERMSRIARIHVFSVIKGKSADEIVTEYLKSKQKLPKPQGYIAPEDYASWKSGIESSGKENIFYGVNLTENREKEAVSKPLYENRIDRIKKVISF